MFVVFDLDGTLADIRHRVHHVRGPGKPDWPAFFAACVNDIPNRPAVAALHAHVNAGHKVEIWSARSDIVRAETEEWLRVYANIDPALLVHMRAADDNTPDVVLKRHWLYRIHPEEWPHIVYDDRQRVVDMWRAMGVACFQVTADWEADTRVVAPTRTPLLTLMVGPSGAGKSTVAANYGPVVGSDDLRAEYTGDFRDQTRNDDVFVAMRRIALARLHSGLPVVLDATHLRRRDRLAAAALCPAGGGVRYVVVDRPLWQKRAHAGWRADVLIGGRPLVDVHHERFQSALKDVLGGDGLPDVTVVDTRGAHPPVKVAA